MEDQAPAAEDKDILQPHCNLLTPMEIEAFKMIALARIQNKYLTRENILLKELITALKGIIRKLEDLYARCATIHHHHHLLHQQRRTEYWVWALLLAAAKLGGGAPVSYHHYTPIFTIFLSSILLVIS